MFSTRESSITEFASPKLPPPKSTSALLKYGSNYDTEVLPVSEELKRKLYELFYSDAELTESMKSLQNTRLKVRTCRARTILGCCASISTNLTCQCCKFTEPEQVLENRVFGLIAKLCEPSRYNGVSVYELVPECELGDLNISPELMLFREIRNSNYLWRDHISRYFSRLHWVAVNFEALRLFREWIEFMRVVNESPKVLLFSNSALEKELLERLVPAIPPRPQGGDFLHSVSHSENLRRYVQERVDGFNSIAYVFDTTPVGVGRFALYDVCDRFTLYSDANGISNSMQYNPVVERLIFERERNRRHVNSVRESATADFGCYQTPCKGITVMESLLEEFGSTAYNWSFTAEDLSLCDWILGGVLDIWNEFIPGETDTTISNYFRCGVKVSSILFATLFIQRPCPTACRVGVKVFSNIGEVQDLAYIACTFATAIELKVGSIRFFLEQTENWIRKKCVADSFCFEYEPYDELLEKCVIVYKFHYNNVDIF